MASKTIRFGVIGCGLMGREFASAAARWCHLLDLPFRPEIVAACDPSPDAREWFQRNVPSLALATDSREALLAADLDAVYVAVPHHLHLSVYLDVIKAGKHLMAEKPFGIDLEAASALAQAAATSSVTVRVSSEFPFFPGAQRIAKLVESGAFGRIIEVRAGFLHSSDLDPTKPMNWKRQVAANGEYGCMGDLGLHVLHLPLRFGWKPRNVRALLSRVYDTRPGADGSATQTETWDNAVLACEADGFPMILQTKRIAPGEMNTWYIEVDGTELSARFTTKEPKTLRTLPYVPGKPQAWHVEDVGYTSAYPTITGGIFEFGFPDALLQMWASFCDQVATGTSRFDCATPEEAAWTHRLFTAALESQKTRNTVEVR
jgi:predicted dehydrogenase